MTYHSELCRAMSMLSDAGAVFLGQAVACDGTAMRSTLKHLPPERLIEMPVAENMQAGMCTGVALAGGLPVCIYPRINFMLEAVSQICNHLDKLPLYSAYRPRVIIRTAIATDKPLDPGPQHTGSYLLAFTAMLKTVRVVTFRDETDIVPAYKEALERDGSTLLIEELGRYDD
jgi:pyruvate/2-oxoglutarate/acetoin dehydrogenase E1 component